MNIWTTGAMGGRVATMAPGPGDVLVLTCVNGRRVLMHPVGEYDHALKLAQAAAARMAPVPVTIRVMCLSVQEAQAMGLAPDGLFQDMTPEEDAQMRLIVVNTLHAVLRDCNEPQPRAEAMQLLRQMGELK